MDRLRTLPLLMLLVSSLILARGAFYFFDDSEGPNLLIVTVGALVLYIPSLAASTLRLSTSNKFVVAILIQALLAFGFYLLLV